jgi:predicted Zn finger-like uncharacterized protein
MYTQCTTCKTTYPISAAQLRAGRGEVVCPRCRRVFDALDALSDTARDAVPDQLLPAKPTALGAGQTVPSSGQDQTMWEEVAGGGLPGPSGAASDVFGRWHEESEAPSSSPAIRAAWWLGSLAMLAALIAQVSVFQGARLAQNEQLRPWLEMLCEELACALPAFKDTRQIQIVDKTLQPAPGGIDGLEFSLVLANQARIPQAFPAIQLVLTDFNNTPVAARVFQPKEYLAELHNGLMPVGKPFEVHLVVVKPLRDVAGFKFELI